MTAPTSTQPIARETYDAFAPIYDEYNQGYMYERWTGRLLEKAKEAGLRGDRLLDVGCGTGLSFIPMLERGFQVTGCDISPGMLELARVKVDEEAATLLVADMRELPRLGQFDLIWAVNDAMNYLLSVSELEATLAGMVANLAPGGRIVFDLNTLGLFRAVYSEQRWVDGRRFVWQGLTSPSGPGSEAIYEARIESLEGEAETHLHRQRYFPETEVLAAADAVGLRELAVYGELDGDLSPGVDEDHHTKFVYVLGA